jgi:hypothetical protein
MFTFAAASFEIISGVVRGGSLSGPAAGSQNLTKPASVASIPPKQQPTITPIFSLLSVSPVYPESAIACALAAKQNFENRAIFRVAFESIPYFVMSKSFTSAAIFTERRLGSKSVMFEIPHFPFFTLFQVSSTVFPTGETTPNPVITTLRRDIKSPLKKNIRNTIDIADSILEIADYVIGKSF